MARINPKLFAKLKSKLGISEGHLYRLIDERHRTDFLPKPLAAAAVAVDAGISIDQFVTVEDLATLRQRGQPSSLPSTAGIAVAIPATNRRPSRKDKRSKGPSNSVFVVHGRNDAVRESLYRFLRSVALNPIEWNKAIRLTRKASPHISEILNAAFKDAVAIVVLLTPDDQACLKKELWKKGESSHEKKLTGQPRPNVLFEAGMAFSSHQNSTILVQVGRVKPFSDVAGRHILHLDDTAEKRREFITKLRNAGCVLDDNGTAWITEGHFEV